MIVFSVFMSLLFFREYKYYFNPLSIKHNFIGKEPIIIEIDNSNLDFLNNMSDRQFVIDKVEEAISSLRRK